MTFQNAITETNGMQRSVLLGNGFSIAWSPAVFDYRRLLDRAVFPGLSKDKYALFGCLDTSDFERAMEVLDQVAKVTTFYGNTQFGARLLADSQVVKNGLASVLANVHPDKQNEVQGHQYESARNFLSNFSAAYALNYDLLTYWAATITDYGGGQPPNDDGFRRSSDGRLVWSLDNAKYQSLFFLHGAFHFYADQAGNTFKMEYDAGAPLIAQVRAAIDRRQYPLVVTEGTSPQKVGAIGNSAYLYHCHQKLRSASGAMFIHGVAMSPNDKHIITTLEASPVSTVCIGLHEDQTDGDNPNIIAAMVNAVARRDKANRPLEVLYYDSSTAKVWNGVTPPTTPSPAARTR